jgi:serine/threonine protein kinase
MTLTARVARIKENVIMASGFGKQVGQQFGNYRLLRLLAQHPFADVYLGEHVFLKTQAAIKVVQAVLTDEELETYLAEVRIIARLKHPNIIRVLEFGAERGLPFLVTDYTPKGSLRQLHPKGSSLAPASILENVRQVAEALQYVHAEHLIHLNLRPENILLGPQNQLLLSDFGTIVLDHSAIPTRSLAETGQGVTRVLDYLAPEQLQGESCPASDQYALAVIVYEWLCPFRGSASDTIATRPLRESAPQIAPAVEQVVTKALAKDPELHFATVSDFAHALEEALQPPVKRIQPLPEIQRRQLTRSSSAAMISALIALVVLVVGASTLLSYEVFSSSRPSFQGAAPTATAQARLATTNARFAGQNPQDIYTHVTNGKPVINDSLRSQDGSTWKDEHLATGTCTFTGGAYHVTAVKNQSMSCLSGRSNLSNFAFQVEMTIVKGDHDYKDMPSYGGISFRVDSSSAKFYRFILGTDGFYVFSVVNNIPLLRNDPILCKIELSAESQKKSLLLG